MSNQTPAGFITWLNSQREAYGRDQKPNTYGNVLNLAHAALKIGAHLSLQDRWDSETPHQVAEILLHAHKGATGVTHFDDEAQTFWIANAGAVGFNAEDYGHELPPTLHFSGNDPDDNERQELNALWRAYQDAAFGGPEELDALIELNAALMKFAQIEEA